MRHGLLASGSPRAVGFGAAAVQLLAAGSVGATAPGMAGAVDEEGFELGASGSRGVCLSGGTATARDVHPPRCSAPGRDPEHLPFLFFFFLGILLFIPFISIYIYLEQTHMRHLHDTNGIDGA